MLIRAYFEDLQFEDYEWADELETTKALESGDIGVTCLRSEIWVVERFSDPKGELDQYKLPLSNILETAHWVIV